MQKPLLLHSARVCRGTPELTHHPDIIPGLVVLNLRTEPWANDILAPRSHTKVQTFPVWWVRAWCAQQVDTGCGWCLDCVAEELGGEAG